MMSRWPTDGNSAFEFTREFVEEAIRSDGASAFQRAVMVMHSVPLRLRDGKRVTSQDPAATLEGSHPFFWAGYMLIEPALPTIHAGGPAAPPPALPLGIK